MKRNMSRTEGPTKRAKVRNFMPFQIGPLVSNRKEVTSSKEDEDLTFL
jgi:hypothetical protein